MEAAQEELVPRRDPEKPEKSLNKQNRDSTYCDGQNRQGKITEFFFLWEIKSGKNIAFVLPALKHGRREKPLLTCCSKFENLSRIAWYLEKLKLTMVKA